METIEKNLIKRIAEGWSREKDNAQPKALETEIQFQLGCTWGKALSIANEIRCGWKVNPATKYFINRFTGSFIQTRNNPDGSLTIMGCSEGLLR